MTIPTNKVIKLTKEGARALNLAPSDDYLIRIVNNMREDFYMECKPATVRWLAIQVLGSYGYKFEV